MIQGDPAARLSVSISNGMTVEVRLGQKEVKIGRGHEADLQLPDRSVSRLHAKVFRVGQQYFLADLRSRNGTHADGKRITQLALEDGRMFQVGPFRIHFHRPASGTSAGEAPTLPPGTASAINDPVKAEPIRVPKRTDPPTIAGEAPFGLIGGSAHVRKLVATIRRVAASDVPVLIEGETGSGKELVARGIHDASARRERPFIVVNCGAISPELIESEVFGHEKGAFTGATAQRKGAFELANSGTIFLDEIGELPFSLQPKLLRALEQKEVKRVGGNDLLRADVRILAATNRNLREEIARKTFRDDLYFRIGAITISIPPLRDRRASSRTLPRRTRGPCLPRLAGERARAAQRDPAGRGDDGKRGTDRTGFLLPAPGGEARGGNGKPARALALGAGGADEHPRRTRPPDGEQDEDGARARDRQVDPVREVEEIRHPHRGVRPVTALGVRNPDHILRVIPSPISHSL